MKKLFSLCAVCECIEYAIKPQQGKIWGLYTKVTKEGQNNGMSRFWLLLSEAAVLVGGEMLDSCWHQAVKHSVGEYVRGEAHTNGIESFWSILKRAHKGTFHKISPKHLDRYVQEFSGKHNLRELDTLHQMRDIARRMVGKRLPYRDLVRDNGLENAAS